MITASTIKVIVILIALSISALSWVYKKMAEQKQLKRTRELRERQTEQALRTGRTEEGIAIPTAPTVQAPTVPNPVAGHADARRRLQELAERRQRQLEELRRKQGNSQSNVTSAASPVPTVQQPPTSRTTDMGPAKPRPSAPAQPSRRTPQSPQQKKTQQAKRAAKPQTRQEARDANQPARDRAGRTPEQAARHAIAERAEQEALQPSHLQQTDASNTAHRKGVESIKAALAGARSGGMNASDWRRVMMMREILDKPMSDRES